MAEPRKQHIRLNLHAGMRLDPNYSSNCRRQVTKLDRYQLGIEEYSA